MALFQAVVIGLLALIITPGYLFYFDVTPKVVVLLAGTAVALLGCGAVDYRGRGHVYRLFSLLLVLNLVSLAISTALSANPALSAFGTNWRRFGSVVQAAILLAHSEPRRQPPRPRPLDPARHRDRRRHFRGVRDRPILRMGSHPARRGLSHRRGDLDHRTSPRHPGIRELLRHLAAVCDFPESGPRRDG